MIVLVGDTTGAPLKPTCILSNGLRTEPLVKAECDPRLLMEVSTARILRIFSNIRELVAAINTYTLTVARGSNLLTKPKRPQHPAERYSDQ